MLPGETIRSGAAAVCDCGTPFINEPMASGAGWFVGTWCHNRQCEHYGEPNSRESGYYPSKEAVEHAMNTNTVNWRE